MTALIKDVRTCIPAKMPPHESTRPEQSHISASQLRLYADCPLAWRLFRTQRPEFTPAALVFGSAFHAAAELFYQARLEGQKAQLQDLITAYDLKWSQHRTPQNGKQPIPIQFSAKSDETTLRDTAVRMLECFLTHAEANIGEVIAVEEEFEVEMAPGLPVLKGRVDLIEVRKDMSGNRVLCLVDFKTAAKRIGTADIDRDQLDLYAIAMRQTGLLEQVGLPLVLRVDAVTKVKAPEIIPITVAPNPDNEKRVVAKAREMWKAMSSGVCYPAPSWRCSSCGHRSLCGKWPDLGQA